MPSACTGCSLALVVSALVPALCLASQLLLVCTPPHAPPSPALCPAGQPPLKRQAELFFPQEFADDFPVAMQISDKYGLVYVITKLGLLFVYDLETATAVYRNRISPDPIFLTANAPESGGFYSINRWADRQSSCSPTDCSMLCCLRQREQSCTMCLLCCTLPAAAVALLWTAQLLQHAPSSILHEILCCGLQQHWQCGVLHGHGCQQTSCLLDCHRTVLPAAAWQDSMAGRGGPLQGTFLYPQRLSTS